MSEGLDGASPPAAKVSIGNDPANNRSAENRHFFGLKTKGIHTGQQDFSDDYEKRFPEDAMFEEVGPNARVWRTYLVESMAFDENMVGEARDGLDAMLVFAGLFSAVVTSFLVQTSANLQPDYTEMSASLLSELIAVQRAAANGSFVDAVPAAALNQNTRFVPDTLDVWVDGLWTVSLTLSLIVALSAVLIKQWLHRYIALRSGTPKGRSHIRHSRFIGFERWQVLGIIGSLPVIMHLSLGLFLLGLFIFLIPLQLVLSCIIGALTFIAYGLYFISNILPIFSPQCPYQTPLSDFIISALVSFRMPIPFLRSSSTEDVSSDVNELSIQALHWLFKVSTNPSVHSVVLQAVGGLPATAALKVRELFGHGDARSVFHGLMKSCFDVVDDLFDQKVKPGSEPAAERLMRTSLICNWRNRFPELELAALRTWREQADSANDPRYIATALSCVQVYPSLDDLQTGPLLRQYVLSHHDIPHHILVWQALVQSSMYNDVFSDYSRDPVLFKLLFRATFGIPGLSTVHGVDGLQPIHTMAHAVLLDHSLHQEFCEYLLSKVLLDNEAAANGLPVPAGDAAERLLMTTLELAIRRLSAEPSNFESVHWQIIDEACGLDFYHRMIRQRHTQIFFKDYVARLIKQTDLCGSHPRGSEAFFKLRWKVLRVYLQSTWDGSLVIVVSHRYLLSGHIEWYGRSVPEDAHASQNNDSIFLQAIEQPLNDIPLVDKQMREHVNVSFSILSSGLLDGATTAYTLAMELDCLGLALKQSYHETDYNGQAVELAGAYAIGLVSNTKIDATTREHYIDYLFRPQNLHLVMVSYILLVTVDPWRIPSELNIRDRVNELVRLRPDQETWDDCRRWLRHVANWARNGRKAEDLEDNQELGDGSILESMLPHRQISHYEVTEQFIRSLDKIFANEERTNVQANDQPHTMPSSARPSLAVPTLEVNAEKVHWRLPRVPNLLRWREKNQEHQSGMELGAV